VEKSAQAGATENFPCGRLGPHALFASGYLVQPKFVGPRRATTARIPNRFYQGGTPSFQVILKPSSGRCAGEITERSHRCPSGSSTLKGGTKSF